MPFQKIGGASQSAYLFIDIAFLIWFSQQHYRNVSDERKEWTIYMSRF